jgi:D-amino-acid dehydrogenase
VAGPPCGGPPLPGLEAVRPEPLDVHPQRGQILHIDVPWARTDTWNIINCFNANYFLSFPPHRVVFGATREEDVGHDGRQTVGGTAMLAGTALELAPGLREATVVEVRVGFRPLSTDGRPLIGKLPGADGLYVANGFGAGLTQSPLAGALIASLVLGKETAIDLEPYRPDRPRPQTEP